MKLIRIVCASLLCAMLAACDSPRTPLDAQDIAAAAQQLESIAHEAGWLAQQLRERRVTPEMAWVHQQALAEDANKAVGELVRPVPPHLRAQHALVEEIAGHIQSQVTLIAGSLNHPEELQALQSRLDSLGQAAHPLTEPA
jgi:hypothetical protein